MEARRERVGVGQLGARSEHQVGGADEPAVGRLGDPRSRYQAGGLERRDGREDRLRIEGPGPREVAHREVAEGALAVEILVDRERLVRQPQVRTGVRVAEDHGTGLVGRGLHGRRPDAARRVARLHRRLKPPDEQPVLPHDRAHVLAGEPEGLHGGLRPHRRRPRPAGER